MRYYRFRRKASKKARTILLRVLFVLAAAALITGAAILTGNLLLRKVENAETLLSANVPPSGNAVERADTNTNFSVNKTDVPQVRASGLSLLSHTTDDSITDRLRTLLIDFDTVSVTITDSSDHADLLYTSPALTELFRMPETTDDPLYTRLKAVANTANHSDLRCSAVLSASFARMDTDTAALVDGTIAVELQQMGFQELLLTDVLGDDADTDAINTLRRYLAAVQKKQGTSDDSLSLGVCLPTSVYLNTANAKQLQMLAEPADFLAMDAADLPTTGPSGTTITGICTSLSGSFQLYSLRVLLTTDDLSLLAAQYTALTEMGITNLHFTGEITLEQLEAATTQDSPTETDVPEEPTAEPLPTTNPYVTTTADGTTDPDSPETEAETEPHTEPETEAETTYRTEGGSWY